MSSRPPATPEPAPSSSSSSSLWLRHWLHEEVLPGVVVFLLIVTPAALYWHGLASPQNLLGFVGVFCCGAYLSQRTTRRRVARARDIASLHRLTDLDAPALKQILGNIPPYGKRERTRRTERAAAAAHGRSRRDSGTVAARARAASVPGDGRWTDTRGR